LFNIPSIGEDFAISGLELVGARLEDLGDDVWSLPWRSQLVTTLVALDEAEHQVPDAEGAAPDPMAVVLAQGLLILGRVEESDVACFIELVQGILKEFLGL
jgi:hypothetical protein